MWQGVRFSDVCVGDVVTPALSRPHARHTYEVVAHASPKALHAVHTLLGDEIVLGDNLELDLWVTEQPVFDKYVEACKLDATGTATRLWFTFVREVGPTAAYRRFWLWQNTQEVHANPKLRRDRDPDGGASGGQPTTGELMLAKLRDEAYRRAAVAEGSSDADVFVFWGRVWQLCGVRLQPGNFVAAGATTDDVENFVSTLYTTTAEELATAMFG